MIRMIGRCSQVPVVEVVGALRLLRSWLFEPDGVGFLRGIWSYIAWFAWSRGANPQERVEAMGREMTAVTQRRRRGARRASLR
eukprot:COSAG03_NODE_7559_length_900_cov_1.189763_1_plen_83_part_00